MKDCASDSDQRDFIPFPFCLSPHKKGGGEKGEGGGGRNFWLGDRRAADFGGAAGAGLTALSRISVGHGAGEIVQLAHIERALVELMQAGMDSRGDEAAGKRYITDRIEEKIDKLAAQIARIARPDHRHQQIGIIAHAIGREGRAEIVVAVGNAGRSGNVENPADPER